MANELMFTNRANNYVKGRAGYAQGVTDLIFTEIFKPKDKVADIGSGTGIFASIFIERGYDVICIEPNQDMRMEAEKIFLGNDHFISINATAEMTTLADKSLNIVTTASAFHWFDAERFFSECKRILKPNGVLFTVANERDYNDLFTLRQHALCKEYCLNFTSLSHGVNKSKPKLISFFGKNINLVEFNYPIEYSKERFIHRSLSSSYAPEYNTDEYHMYVKKLWELLNEFAPDSSNIIVPNKSIVLWGKIN